MNQTYLVKDQPIGLDCEPSRIVTLLEDKLSEGARILVPGCGYGRNAIYLAQRGFEVIGVDSYTDQLAIAQSLIDGSNDISIQLIAGDIRDEELLSVLGRFDAVLVANIIHFLSEPEGYSFIDIMKKITLPGGYNAYHGMVDHPEHKDTTRGKGYAFKPGELRRIYSTWNAKEYKEFLGQFEEHPVRTANGIRNLLHRHFFVDMLAQKPI